MTIIFVALCLLCRYSNMSGACLHDMSIGHLALILGNYSKWQIMHQRAGSPVVITVAADGNVCGRMHIIIAHSIL